MLRSSKTTYLLFIFREDYFLRTIVNCVLGNNYIIKADAAGVQGMAPIVFLAVPPTQSSDGHPTVNKQGVQ